jgi:hypothetical protein
MMSRLIVVGLVIASAACAKTIGTETGNPPVIAPRLIEVEAIDEDHVRVSGDAGAISPGGGEVSITNQSRGDDPVVVEVAEDGSFSAELPGTTDDDYEVVASNADGSSQPRSVGGGGMTNDDWQTLHVCAESDPVDPLFIEALRIEGDTLHVDVSHGGGCEQHRYGLCYEEAWAGSSPLQVGLRVLHDDGGDTCDALRSESLTFDLARLKDAYAEMFGEGPGALSLGFDDCTVTGQPPSMCQVLYEWGEPGKPCGPPIGPDCPGFEIPAAPATWVEHPTACSLSFRGPDDLMDLDVMGTDSCVDEFENASCTVDAGSGAFSSGLTDLEDGNEEVVVGRATIDGVEAKVVTAVVSGNTRPYVAGAHFPHPPLAMGNFGVSADVVISCTSREERDAMLSALGTVRFE